MRVFSYVLTALVTIFVLNVALSFSLPAYRNVFIDIRENVFGEQPKSPAIEEKEKETVRLIESLDRIDRHIESLVETAKPEIVEEEVPVEEVEIPLSGIFLSKIMPEVTPKKIENAGFFDIPIMGNIVYTTYADEKRNIKIYAFGESYDTLLQDMEKVRNLYTTNETDQFFWYTFFLNPVKTGPGDTVARFVTSVEGRAIGMEVPRTYYPTLKTILLKK